MKYSEIKVKSEAELQKLLKEKRMELFKARLQLKTMQLKDTSIIRKLRKDIARILTALKEKQLEKDNKKWKE